MARQSKGSRERIGSQHFTAFKREKEKILKSCDVCAICGAPIDKTLKFPHPLSPSIDHIIPVSKGGHPSNPDNLQLTHLACNRAKADKIYETTKQQSEVKIFSNEILPLTCDWKAKRKGVDKFDDSEGNIIQ